MPQFAVVLPSDFDAMVALRHGFVPVGESDFDVDYRWSVQAGVTA